MFEKPLAIACLILLVYSVVTTISLRNETREHAEFKAAVKMAQQQAEKEYSDALSETTDKWAEVVSYLNTNPRIVRVPMRPNCNIQETPAPSQGTNVTTEEPGLRDEIIIAVQECEQRLNFAAEDAAKLIVLQEYITNTHEDENGN
jgi:hypothetical protein